MLPNNDDFVRTKSNTFTRNVFFNGLEIPVTGPRIGAKTHGIRPTTFLSHDRLFKKTPPRENMCRLVKHHRIPPRALFSKNCVWVGKNGQVTGVG